ncbi:MAG: hypothetical protein J6V89_07255 [Acetobacter sp.]|nr:hypothetical protein [Acetobacter sp.]
MRGSSPCAPSALILSIPQAVGAEEPIHSNAAFHGSVFRINKTKPEKSTYPQK